MKHSPLILLALAAVFGCAEPPSRPNSEPLQTSHVGINVVVPITRTFRGGVATTTDATSFSTGSYTPLASRILIATVQNTKGASPDAVSSFSGNGLTWTLIQTVVDNANLRRMSQFWAATGASPTTGAATADFAGATQTSAHIRVDEFDGLNLSAPVGDTDVKNPSGSHTSLALNLVFSNANNGTYAAMGYNGSSGSTPTASNITQLSANNLASPSNWMMTGWDAGNQTTPGWSAGSWTWWGAGFEMVAAPEHPNEPAGMTVRIDELPVTATGVASPGWVIGSGDSTLLTVIDPASVPSGHGATSIPFLSPTGKIFEGTLPLGFDYGKGPYNINRTWTPSGNTEIYIDEWIMIDPLYNGTDSGSTGVSKDFGWIEINSGNQQYMKLTDTGTAIHIDFTLQACMKSIGDMSATGGLFDRVASNVTRGKWYRMIRYMKLNTAADVADGIAMVWFGDENTDFSSPSALRVNLTHVGYAGNNTQMGQPFGSKWNKYKLNPTYVSGDGDNPALAYHWLGNPYVSTK